MTLGFPTSYDGGPSKREFQERESAKRVSSPSFSEKQRFTKPARSMARLRSNVMPDDGGDFRTSYNHFVSEKWKQQVVFISVCHAGRCDLPAWSHSTSEFYDFLRPGITNYSISYKTRSDCSFEGRCHEHSSVGLLHRKYFTKDRITKIACHCNNVSFTPKYFSFICRLICLLTIYL